MPRYRKSDPRVLLAGSLTQPLIFLKRELKTVSGKSTETWVELMRCRGSVEPYTGQRMFEAAADNRQDEAWFTIRYRAGLPPNLRIEHRGEVYEVTAISNPGMTNVKLEMLGKRLNGGGS